MQRIAFTITESVKDHTAHANCPRAQHRFGRAVPDGEKSCRDRSLPAAPLWLTFAEVDLPFDFVSEKLSPSVDPEGSRSSWQQADRRGDRSDTRRRIDCD